MALVRYLARLNIAQRVLWCYLIWYLEVLARYFDPNPRLWLSSAGISVIIGTGLYLSTVHASRQKTALAGWQIARLYIMPLCVSSFAALIKDRGFVLVFHPNQAANLHATAACVLFLGVAWLARVAERSTANIRAAGASRSGARARMASDAALPCPPRS